LKARAAGYRTVVEPRAVVVHREYGTSGKVSATELMLRNQTILVRRWRQALGTQPISLWELPPDRDRPQVLVLGTAVEGANPRAVRLRLLVETLARDYQVAYAHLTAATADRRLRIPNDWAVTVFHPGFARAVGSDVLDLGAILLHNRFQWAVFDTAETAAIWVGLIREYGRGVRVAMDVVPGEPLGEAVPGVDALLTATTTERDRIQRARPRSAVGVLPADPAAWTSTSSRLSPLDRLFGPV
ncbi:MAG TPA: hypothetical protein VIX35_13530, partial [Vicinamibacterales bacterium]